MKVGGQSRRRAKERDFRCDRHIHHLLEKIDGIWAPSFFPSSRRCGHKFPLLFYACPGSPSDAYLCLWVKGLQTWKYEGRSCYAVGANEEVQNHVKLASSVRVGMALRHNIHTLGTTAFCHVQFFSFSLPCGFTLVTLYSLVMVNWYRILFFSIQLRECEVFASVCSKRLEQSTISYFCSLSSRCM